MGWVRKDYPAKLCLSTSIIAQAARWQ